MLIAVSIPHISNFLWSFVDGALPARSGARIPGCRRAQAREFQAVDALRRANSRLSTRSGARIPGCRRAQAREFKENLSFNAKIRQSAHECKTAPAEPSDVKGVALMGDITERG
jgi:hypothetical protein